MGSAAETTEPTPGTEKHQHPLKMEQQVAVEEEDEQVVELERKTSSFHHGKRPESADGSSTITTTTTSSSSSFSGDGEGEHIGIENLEVPESSEKETEVVFHEEHHDENSSNVYFDGEQGIWKCRHCDWTYREESLLCFETKGSEPADAETDAHESQTADHLKEEEKQPESVNGSTSEDNKGSLREIEEVQEGDFPKEVDAADQPTRDVIEEEEVDIDDVEDYNVEKVLDNQETHDLFCPNCNSCITKRVVLKKRKRKISHVLEDPKRVRGPHPIDPILRSEDNLTSAGGGDNPVPVSFFYKCLSCFSIFIPTGVDSNPVPPSESVEGLNTQPKPQQEATGNSKWFGSMFGSKGKKPPVQQGGAMPSIPEASPSRDIPNLLVEDTTGSTSNIPSKAPALVQDGPDTLIQDVSEISVSQDNKPLDAPLIQVANSHDTSKGVNNVSTVEDGQQFLPPSAEEGQTLQKIDREDASAAVGNHSPEKGRLSPIRPSRDMNVSNTVISGPDGVRVETIFHADGFSHQFEGTDPKKPDFGLNKVTGGMDLGDGGPSRGIDIPSPPVSSLEEGTLTEPLVIPDGGRPIVEGRKVEILKSIVYGGLIEAITSLGVISSAAGSGASTLNILVLGLANLFGGLILIIHNLQELREEVPRRPSTEDSQTNGQEEGRYKRLLGRRENFTLHATFAILSFIITGLLPPIVYYFSFSESHNRNYKVASVFGASLLCIVLLAAAKAHVRSPRGSHLKSVLYYATIAVSVSGISYAVGTFVDQLLEKYGWSDGSETPAGEMMLALMGRKAGGFGYKSSY